MKTETVEKLLPMPTVTASQKNGNEQRAISAVLTARIYDPREMDRAELESYLQSTEYFPTKSSLLEFARRYNVPVNARTQREEIIRLCLRMIYDIPASFAGLRAAERAPTATRASGTETRKVLENFFVGSKLEERTEGQDVKKIAANLLDGILHCHEAGLLLTQVRGADVDMFRQVLETCENPIDAHVRFLSNVADFARLEAKTYKLAHIPFRLSDCLGGALKNLAFSAHQKGLELCYSISADTPEYVIGDPARLQQILLNLVDNAVKFTETGEIIVEIKKRKPKTEKHKDDQGTLDFQPETCDFIFSVRDTGVGMTQNQLQTIQELFSTQERDKVFPLGGLGLLISHRLVQLMGGQMEVTSESNSGSTISFSVPLLSNKSSARGSATKPTALHGQRLLVVESHGTHQRILQNLLQSWGAQVALAASGREALALLYKQPEDDPFPAIVIDGRLADIEGFASIRRQHLAEDPARVSPVIIMLASLDPAREMERYRDLHVAAFLHKPITPAELSQALLEALASRARPFKEAVFDRAALWSLVAEDANLLLELIGLFDQDCPRLFFSLQQAMMMKNAQEVVAAAQVLQGTVNNFAAYEAARVLTVIKSLGGRGDFVQVQEAMTQLAAELARLKLALEDLRKELVVQQGARGEEATHCIQRHRP